MSFNLSPRPRLKPKLKPRSNSRLNLKLRSNAIKENRGWGEIKRNKWVKNKENS